MEIILLAGAADGTAEVEQYFAQLNGGVIAEINGNRVLLHHVIRIAQVPGDIIHVAEDMAARAGGFAIAGKARSIIDHGSSLYHNPRLRLAQALPVRLWPARHIDHP